MRVLSRRPLFIDGSAVSKKSFMIILRLFFYIKIRKIIFTHIFETWVFVNRWYDLRPKVGPVENSKMSRQNNLLNVLACLLAKYGHKSEYIFDMTWMFIKNGAPIYARFITISLYKFNLFCQSMNIQNYRYTIFR